MQAKYQADLDAWWAALLRNERETVIGTLAEAFEDNEAAAAPLGVEADEVSIVVLAPGASIVPERMPGRTASGNLSLRKLNNRERSALYTEAVMGHALVTIKEALAVAPGIQSVRLVALRHAETTPTDDRGSIACLPGVGRGRLFRGSRGRRLKPSQSLKTQPANFWSGYGPAQSCSP